MSYEVDDDQCEHVIGHYTRGKSSKLKILTKRVKTKKNKISLTASFEGHHLTTCKNQSYPTVGNVFFCHGQQHRTEILVINYWTDFRQSSFLNFFSAFVIRCHNLTLIKKFEPLYVGRCVLALGPQSQRLVFWVKTTAFL